MVFFSVLIKRKELNSFQTELVLIARKNSQPELFVKYIKKYMFTRGFLFAPLNVGKGKRQNK